MAELMTVGQTAKVLSERIGSPVPAWKVTNLFYSGQIDSAGVVELPGRRLIPAEMIPEIETAVRGSLRSLQGKS